MDDVNVAYLTNCYPAPTHTFIRNEILGLEELGCVVHRFSHHRTSAVVDALDIREQLRTRHLSGRFAWRAASGVILTFARRPVRAIIALWYAVQLAGSGDRRFIAHVGHFMLACALSEELAKIGDPHIHAHFGISPTDVAHLCFRLRGLSYSFTLHAAYEYDQPELLNLRAKIAAAEFVVAISHHGRNSLVRRFPEFGDKIKLIPCGLTVDWLKRPTVPVAAGRRLVSVARLERQKNLELLLRGLAAVKAQGIPFKLSILGDGALKTQLKKLICELQLDKAVTLLGWCTLEEVQRHVSEADALVLASESEGIPMAILEAASLARPSIATDVGGVGEVVQSGETGWLVPPRNLGALEHALIDCLRQPQAELQRLGENARTGVLSLTTGESAAMLKQLFVLGQIGRRSPR